jgi:hypothetical protein
VKHYQERLNKLLKIAISEVKALNIPVSDNIYPEVIINYRAKKRFGACKIKTVKNIKHFQIEIGSALSVSGDDIIKGVLIHEILHSCEGCCNHGKLWKKYADMINRNYGYNIKRTSTYEEYGIKDKKEKITYRYKICCSNCSRTSYRIKKSNIVKYPNKYRCICGGKLIVEVL